ncbi:acyltransferase [Clostridium hydrogenum]|uniref:acyltransferase n=1 Tax=Clostridium hydrogenum TaxID=2855764 RepID=UPI001F390F56|nr:acyltransferase [Clostridium hydrogenum]
MKAIVLNSNKRLKEIDILKAAAFVFVVAQHTIGGYSNGKNLSLLEYSILKFLYVSAKPAVPIFLFISGVLFFKVYEEKLDIKKFYLKKIKYILIPYIIWSSLNMYFLKNTDRFKDFIIEIIGGNGAYHLWYMGMIVRLYLIFPLIFYAAKKIHKSNIVIRMVTFISLIVLYYEVSKYNNVISDYVGKMIFGKPTELEMRIVNISFIFWYLYFALGIYVGLNYDFIKQKLLKSKLLIFIIYVFLLIYAYLNETNSIGFIRSLSIAYYCFSILAVYLGSIMLSERIKIYKIMSFVSKYSFSAYMLHIIVINYVVQYLRSKLFMSDYLMLGILSCILVAIISPIIIKCLSFVPFSSYITGVKCSKIKLSNYGFEIKIWRNTQKGSRIIYKAGSYKVEG